jgi:uncharacterized protein
MPVVQPRISSGNGKDPKNPYQGRWRWWYPGIADWIIRNPEGKLQDCALELQKAYTTIAFIVRTDLFQEYLAQRRQQWQKDHDFTIVAKVTRVAERSLDLLLDKMEKQADKIPMQLVTEVATSALDRLGYGPKTSGAAVNVNVNNGQQVVMMPISAAALEEARDAIREAEKKKALEERQTLDLLPTASEASGGSTTLGLEDFDEI